MNTDLIEILRKLNPAGLEGFEGLIAQLLEALTGQRFFLARSGSQAGRDMSSHSYNGNIIAVECKRYDKSTELDERELLGEFVQVSRDIIDLELWVLVASKAIPSQLEDSLRREATARGVEYFSLSTGDGSPSSLEVLCASFPEIVISHPGIQKIPQTNKIKDLLEEITQNPQTPQKIAELRTAFTSSLLGYENWREAQNNWLLDCLTSENETRAQFGQPININDTQVKLIEREDALAALDGWFQNWKIPIMYLLCWVKRVMAKPGV